MMQRNQIIRAVIFFVCAVLLWRERVLAQDTSKRKTIEITSTFKPVLREAVKINFNAAPPSVDSSRPTLNYTVPAQNLFFNYNPINIKPVSLQIDSASSWPLSNYIKAGVGNVHIPYLQTGLSFGDGQHSFYNIFAKHLSSKGSLPFQKNNQTGVSVAGTYRTPGKLEWSGKLGFNSEDYFFYGFQPDTLDFTKGELRQRFQTFEGQVSLRNTEPTTYGLNYNPNFKTSVFSGKNAFRDATEANTVLNIPVQKTFGKSFGFNLGLTADLTTYRPAGKQNIQNNLYYITPSLLLKTPNLYLQAGLMPSWDNKAFTMLPNILADITTNDQQFTVQLGWIGYYNKGTYQRFASINPWILQPDELMNTRVQERYFGIKGRVLENFSYSAKIGLVQYRNMPLFVNDTADGKTFLVVYSPAVDALQLHGEIGYALGEKFSASAALTINKFTKVKDQSKAWGMLPIEFTSTMRWQLLKDVWLKGDLYAWDGPAYRTREKQARKGDKAFDLNAGLEFKVTKQLNLWLQLNNIFNNRYERWHQYEVYGFNVLGGVIFSF